MKESHLQSKISRKLNEIDGVDCFVYHGSPFAHKGHSDLYGHHHGKAFYMEVKVPGKKHLLTALQQNFLARMKNDGANAGVVSSIEEALELIGIIEL